jgi:DNA-binding beta-propeller fold protein YncE
VGRMKAFFAVAISIACSASAADTLVVGHKPDNSIGFYDCGSGAILHNISGIRSPRELSVSHDRKFVFVTSYSSDSKSVTIIDLSRRQKVGQIPLERYARLGGMHVSTSGKLYVAAAEPGALLVIDPVKRALLQSVRLGNRAPRMITVDEAEQFAYAANPESGTLSVIDLNTLQTIQEVQTFGATSGLTLNQDSTVLYAATRNNNSIALIGARPARLLQRWFVQGHPVRLALIPDRRELLSAQVHTGDLALLSLNGSEIARMPIGSRVSGLAVDRRGEHAYVAAPASNIVVQVSLKDWKRQRIFRTLSGPDPVVILEETRTR